MAASAKRNNVVSRSIIPLCRKRKYPSLSLPPSLSFNRTHTHTRTLLCLLLSFSLSQLIISFCLSLTFFLLHKALLSVSVFRPSETRMYVCTSRLAERLGKV
jgi:hypothetical protein